MLQQTQVATVRDYYARWLVRFPDFNALAAASEADVLHVWQGLGYYARARNLHRAAQEVAANYGGKLPDDLAAIAALPGVGRYTAGAVASFAFDRATPIIDANIARVLARLLNLQEPIDTTRGSEILWKTAEELLPARGGRMHNSALMELGALICTPRSPQCLICPVREHCRAKNPETLPKKKAAPENRGAYDRKLRVDHTRWKNPPRTANRLFLVGVVCGNSPTRRIPPLVPSLPARCIRLSFPLTTVSH